MSDIPKEFCNARFPRVTADTVGELKEKLNLLPDELCIQQGSGEGVMLIVYNVSDDERTHLAFEEVE